jgi:Domain of unknown function (DUF427)
MESVWDYPAPRGSNPRRPAWWSSWTERSWPTPAAACGCWRPATRPSTTSPPPTSAPSGCAPRPGATVCEFKGAARYYDAGDRAAVAWSYAAPGPGYEAVAGHFAFYPGRVDKATVDGEQVKAQPGDFYGGWITSAVTGPFKGGPGTTGW